LKLSVAEVLVGVLLGFAPVIDPPDPVEEQAARVTAVARAAVTIKVVLSVDMGMCFPIEKNECVEVGKGSPAVGRRNQTLEIDNTIKFGGAGPARVPGTKTN